MLLFFDVETTGLADFNKRARDPSQPHLVQLAAMLTEDKGKVVESHYAIIKPEGWRIPQEATDVNGISHDYAMEVGIHEKRATMLLLDMMKKARLLVAHNLQFDKFLARIACRRYELLLDEHDQWWKGLPGFCTMRETTELCELPKERGNGYKWPKLREAYLHIFERELSNAHDALADVTACKDIYFWLHARPAGAKRGELI